MTELTKILRKSYEKLEKILRKTYEHRILIVDKSKHRVKWRIFFSIFDARRQVSKPLSLEDLSDYSDHDSDDTLSVVEELRDLIKNNE